MRVGSGRRMRSRRRVGRLPPTMSRRTFEVLDGLVVVVIANATTTLSGVLIPPWRHRAQEIGAKLSLRAAGPGLLLRRLGGRPAAARRGAGTEDGQAHSAGTPRVLVERAAGRGGWGQRACQGRVRWP